MNHKISPDNKSSSESNVEAIIAIEALTIDAYTLAMNKIMFA